MDIDSMIAVLQAHKEGKKIERRAHGSRDEWELVPNSHWNFPEVDYRIVSEPLVLWVNLDNSSSGYSGGWAHPTREAAVACKHTQHCRTVRMVESPEEG